ncbi:hypothetical protein [Engelhardtia mirabilis]|uniref:Lipoprotein n=1 Tax=Engelhardtia mirabilis TaxID=2528011 RepID=A0A518BM77_9BACT|nr:hypothetical protein Pla133_31790 [Planctomycetes bacterium Pla133]QDV02411.1 hypothetical protein Pla86_31780 [Planctomycetes bacterium Pla86]
MIRRLTAPLAVTVALLAGGCATSKLQYDPTVIIDTRGGRELGVSTNYGIVFLGRTARAGDVDVAVWFGDGPSIEQSVIEPVGGGLYTVDTEIRVPSIPLGFTDPADGQPVWIQGRDVNGRWRMETQVVRHPTVDGILLAVPDALVRSTDQTGAGVFVYDEKGRARVLGLVSGRLMLETTEGTESYLTVVGPESLWRLVSYRRDPDVRHRVPYRDDVL